MQFSVRCVWLLAVAAFYGGAVQVRAAEKPNVLLILVDDLKPTLGCYGEEQAKTPNLDRLAARGMRFELAYCNQAVCAPSRFNLMLGSHSTSTGLYGLGTRLREHVPDAVTLPQHFATHGYRTESLGKVFHIGHGNEGDPQSFSVPHFHDKVIEYADPASTEGGKLTREEAYFTNQKLGQIRSLPRGAAFESPDVPDATYADGRVAEETIKRLQAAKARRDREGTPFFIASGYARPHLPFSAPKKYWDLYDPAKLPQPKTDGPPVNAPRIANKTNSELANYFPVPPSGIVDETLARQLIHGYFAGVSYVDAQIGKVLDAVDRLDLADDTIVVLWGDHGWHLGDHGLWTKHTNYEQANRIPLIIAGPGVNAGASTRQLAETVDLYPTLAELAGLPGPAGPQAIDGRSLVPVLRDPATRVRDHAYHMFPRKVLGRAIRTERYRLVEWRKVGGEPSDAEIELYDYETDPQELRNHANDRPEVVVQLRQMLAAYPAPLPQGGKPGRRSDEKQK
ncbi:Choline-sulfatase [Caulifigura coniformis]|uniref:Choline-sulfatase n=1 Tax=Caulifigura coniformis TaxID=2527983 RepID=A0A517SD54_9PLAN|nr:sulfatase [Caulifigura coniformis]QDT54060.1 Choline-sulfatase [Caulifigura coniformis]